MIVHADVKDIRRQLRCPPFFDTLISLCEYDTAFEKHIFSSCLMNLLTKRQRKDGGDEYVMTGCSPDSNKIVLPRTCWKMGGQISWRQMLNLRLCERTFLSYQNPLPPCW